VESEGTEPTEPIHYSVRLSLRAHREAVASMLWLEELTGGPELALEWYDGLLELCRREQEAPLAEKSCQRMS